MQALVFEQSRVQAVFTRFPPHERQMPSYQETDSATGSWAGVSGDLGKSGSRAPSLG